MHNVQPSLYRKGIQHSELALLLNPIVSFHFLSVGLSPTQFIFISGDVTNEGALDYDRSAPIEWTGGPQDPINACGLIQAL